MTDRLIDWFIDLLIDLLIGWLICWLVIDLLIGNWFIGWMTCWLIDLLNRLFDMLSGLFDRLIGYWMVVKKVKISQNFCPLQIVYLATLLCYFPRESDTPVSSRSSIGNCFVVLSLGSASIKIWVSGSLGYTGCLEWERWVCGEEGVQGGMWVGSEPLTGGLDS